MSSSSTRHPAGFNPYRNANLHHCQCCSKEKTHFPEKYNIMKTSPINEVQLARLNTFTVNTFLPYSIGNAVCFRMHYTLCPITLQDYRHLPLFSIPLWLLILQPLNLIRHLRANTVLPQANKHRCPQNSKPKQKSSLPRGVTIVVRLRQDIKFKRPGAYKAQCDWHISTELFAHPPKLLNASIKRSLSKCSGFLDTAHLFRQMRPIDFPGPLPR